MLTVLDFESDGIDTRPNFPPKPCGLAVYTEGEEPYYMAWGHPTENNIDYEIARIKTDYILWEDPRREFIFHNAPFDCSILEEKMGLRVPWERVHDTMVLAFLDDPFGELSLKPLSAQLLGMPPDEQEAVRDWLVAHGVCRSNDKSWGAHISKAPGKLVGTYAIGDVVRTLGLYKYYVAKMAAPPEIKKQVAFPAGFGPVWATGSVPREAYGDMT